MTAHRPGPDPSCRGVKAGRASCRKCRKKCQWLACTTASGRSGRAKKKKKKKKKKKYQDLRSWSGWCSPLRELPRVGRVEDGQPVHDLGVDHRGGPGDGSAPVVTDQERGLGAAFVDEVADVAGERAAVVVGENRLGSPSGRRPSCGGGSLTNTS